jgi:uncharacterized protein (TIGR03083 family)
MAESRVEALIARLEKGGRKTQEIMSELKPEQWQTVVYTEPYPWTVRDLLAHFLSAEEALLRIAQNVAGGEPGIPEGFDFDVFNAEERKRLAGRSPQELLTDLDAARQVTLDWLRALPEDSLDRAGRHPVLGDISLEAMLTAIYGHQLLHVRDLQRMWEH